jgi:cell division protein FtsQ
VGEAFILGDLNSRKKTKRKWSAKTVLWIVILALVLVALLQLVFGLFVSPYLQIQRVRVKSDFAISKEEILSIAGLQRKEYYFSVNSDAIRERLEAHPMVQRAVVEKIFPNKLTIELIGRSPLAISLIDAEIAAGENPKNVAVAFDKDGVVFQIGKSVTDWNLPVLSGLKFRPLLGARLPEKLSLFLTQLEEIHLDAPTIFDLISEIKLVEVGGKEIELLLYPIGYPVKVNLGGRIEAEQLKYVFMVLDVLDRQGALSNIEELDFRAPKVVYRMREE